MGSEYNPKKRFDITMSRRTRKPLKNLIDSATENLNSQHYDSSRSSEEGKESAGDHTEITSNAELKDDHISLKKVINTVQDAKPSQVFSSKRNRGSGSSESTNAGATTGTSLSQHFKDDHQQLQLVVRKQDGHGHTGGMKLNKMMKRYIKSLFRKRE